MTQDSNHPDSTDSNPNNIDVRAALDGFAAETGAVTDPLADIVPSVERAERANGSDLLDVFLAAKVQRDNIGDRAQENYEQSFRRWEDHMKDMGRHPACANEAHAHAFVERLLTGDTPAHVVEAIEAAKANPERNPDKIEWSPNRVSTVRHRTILVKAAYKWFASQNSLPHPVDYNPITAAVEGFPFHLYEADDGGNGDGSGNRAPYIPLREIQRAITETKNVRERAILITQLKLGLRRSELANIAIPDVHISTPREVMDHYPQMATSEGLRDPYNGEVYEDAVVIPADKTGNKSQTTRVLPLDDEVQKALSDYLLIRPDNPGEDALILSQESYESMATSVKKGRGVARVWNEAFWPKVSADKPNHMASHFARHYFTTHFEKIEEVSARQVDYMRGDVGNGDRPARSADDYVNIYYPDIKDVYGKRIYRLDTV